MAASIDNVSSVSAGFTDSLTHTFSTTGTDKVVYLHVNAFFRGALPTVTSPNLTWTKFVEEGTGVDSWSAAYFAEVATALTDEVITISSVDSASFSAQTKEWSGVTSPSGLTAGVDYGTDSTTTNASLTDTLSVTVATQETNSHVHGFVGGFIGGAWTAGADTTIDATVDDFATFKRDDDPQSSTGSYTLTVTKDSAITDDWRSLTAIGYEVLEASGAGGVTGTSATTNATDTSSASGTTTVTGTSTTTNAADTSSASGTTTVVGSSAVTQGADTSNASGAVGSAVTGSVDVTEGADTSSASGNVEIQGSSATTNSADTSSAEGTTTVLGTLSVTEIGDISDASGSAGNVTGTVSYTNNPDTATAVGVVPIPAGSGGAGGHSSTYWDDWWNKPDYKDKKKRKKLSIKAKQVIQEVAQTLPDIEDDITDEQELALRLKLIANKVGYNPLYLNALQDELQANRLAMQRDEEDVVAMLMIALV